VTFQQALEAALIKFNPQRTNTPVDVLAAHMERALAEFETTLLERARHPFYAPGRPHEPL
jgi:hypothetical protein